MTLRAKESSSSSFSEEGRAALQALMAQWWREFDGLMAHAIETMAQDDDAVATFDRDAWLLSKVEALIAESPRLQNEKRHEDNEESATRSSPSRQTGEGDLASARQVHRPSAWNDDEDDGGGPGGVPLS
jgi:hypothetical protein